MTARNIIGDVVSVLGTGLVSVPSPSTVIFDFGGPGDLYLPAQPGFTPGCRVVVVLGGNADSPGEDGGKWADDGFTFAVLDAEDNNGVIGEPAPAVTDDGVPVGEPGRRSVTFGVQLRANRPWIRCVATKSNSTKVTGRAIVLAIPASC